MRKPQQQLSSKPTGVASSSSLPSTALTSPPNTALGSSFAASAVAAGKRRQQEILVLSPSSNPNNRTSSSSHFDAASVGPADFGFFPGGGDGSSRKHQHAAAAHQGDPGETFDVAEIDLSAMTTLINSSSLGQTIVRERRVEILPNVVLLRTLVRRVVSSHGAGGRDNDEALAAAGAATSSRTLGEKEIASGPIVQSIRASDEPRVVLYLDTGWFHFLEKGGAGSYMLVLPKKRDIKTFASLIEKHLLLYRASSSNSIYDRAFTNNNSNANFTNRIMYSPRMSAEIQLPLGVSFPTQHVFVGEDDGEIKDPYRMFLTASSSSGSTVKDNLGNINTNNNNNAADGGGAEAQDDENQIQNSNNNNNNNNSFDSILTNTKLRAKMLQSSGDDSRIDLSLIRDLELRKLLEATGDATASDVNTFLNFGVTPLAPAIVETAQALLLAAQSSNPVTGTLAKLAEAISSSLTTHEISGRMHLALPVCRAAVTTFSALLQLASNSPISCVHDGVGDSIVSAIERCVSCLLVGGYESCLGTVVDGKSSTSTASSSSCFQTSTELDLIAQMTRELTQQLASALVLIESYHAVINDRVPVTRLWSRENNLVHSELSADDSGFEQYCETMDQLYRFNNGNNSRRNGSMNRRSSNNNNISNSNNNNNNMMMNSNSRNSGSALWLRAAVPIIHRAFMLMTSLLTAHPNLSQKVIQQDLPDMFPSRIVQATYSTATTFLSSSASAARTKNSDAFVSLHCCLSLSKLATKMLIAWTNRVLSTTETETVTSSSGATLGLSGQVILRSCATALNFCTMLLENSITERSLAAITSRSIVNRESAATTARHLLVSKAWEADSREAMFRIFHLHVRLCEIVTYLSTTHHHHHDHHHDHAHQLAGVSSSPSSPSSMCWDQAIVILSTPLRRSASWFGTLFPSESFHHQHQRQNRHQHHQQVPDENGTEDSSSSSVNMFDDNNGNDFFSSGNTYDGVGRQRQQQSTSASSSSSLSAYANHSSLLQQDVRQVMARAACRFLSARSSVEGMAATSLILSSACTSPFFEQEVEGGEGKLAEYGRHSTNKSSSSSSLRAQQASKPAPASAVANQVQHIILPTSDFQPGAVWLVRCAILCGASALRTETIGAAAVLLRLQMVSMFSSCSSAASQQQQNKGSSCSPSTSSFFSSSSSSTTTSSHLCRIERVWTRWCSQLNAIMTACPQPSTAHSVWSTANLIVHRFAQSAVIILQKSSGITNVKEFVDGEQHQQQQTQSKNKKNRSRSTSPSASSTSRRFHFLQARGDGEYDDENEGDDKRSNPPLLCATMLLSVPSAESLRTFSSPVTAAASYSGSSSAPSSSAATAGGGDDVLFDFSNAAAAGAGENDDDEDKDLMLIQLDFGGIRDENYRSNNNSNLGRRNNKTKGAGSTSSPCYYYRHRHHHHQQHESMRPPDATAYLAADAWDGLAEFENDRLPLGVAAGMSEGGDGAEDAGRNSSDQRRSDRRQQQQQQHADGNFAFLSSSFDDAAFYSNSPSSNTGDSNGRSTASSTVGSTTITAPSSSSSSFALSLAPNVQDEAFWYIDKSCEDRQENVRLMTVSRRRLLAVQDAREAAAAPPSRCAVFAARAIRDFARAFFRTSQDIFDDDVASVRDKNITFQQQMRDDADQTPSPSLRAMLPRRKVVMQHSQHTISLICSELSNLLFYGSGSVQHACLALLPVLACIRQTGDRQHFDDSSHDDPRNFYYSKTNNSNNNSKSSGNIFSGLGRSGFDATSTAGNDTVARKREQQERQRSSQIPMKKESILISTLRSQRMLNEGQD